MSSFSRTGCRFQRLLGRCLTGRGVRTGGVSKLAIDAREIFGSRGASLLHASETSVAQFRQYGHRIRVVWSTTALFRIADRARDQLAAHSVGLLLVGAILPVSPGESQTRVDG
jgi:hypothetical protein